MAFDVAAPLDGIDARILEELQRDARITFAELGRRVSMSAPAVADRVRRLEERGVILGYRPVVDRERLGHPILAFVRIRPPRSDHRRFEAAIAERPEVLECHHVTGEDCYILKVAARSMRHLEETTSHLSRFGAVTTSVVYSTPVSDRDLRAPSS